MSTAGQVYRVRGRNKRSQHTRERIMGAVRELLEEGSFHESTVEQVADRAGVSRATLYQHFRSRLDLVDAICDSFAVNPALIAIRAAEDLDELIASTVRFWASEDAILAQLYGAAAIDPAAKDFVARQRTDRRGEVERVMRLAGRTDKRSLALVMTLTSYETFSELRRAGLSDRQVTELLRDTAATSRSSRAARTSRAS
ncbi:MAG TPA: helix-turn-helix domain-containing protein [Thermoleophilaceae bacterium]|nr:helix-turn-helix domain-containing protein [Thermoleophilaceae bacterium]